MNYYEMTQVRNEQVKDWLREAEHDRLVRSALKSRVAGVRFGIDIFGWSGLSFLVAGLLFVVVSLVHLPGASTATLSGPGERLIHLSLLAALLLVLWGLVGLHIRQRERAGRVGLIGFALALFGTVLLAGSILTEAFLLPFIGMSGELPDSVGPLLRAFIFTPPVMVAGAGVYLGYWLVGLARLRAGRLPFHAGLVLSVGAQAAIFISLLAPASAAAGIGLVAFGLGYMGLGYVLLAGRGRAALQAQA